MFLGPCENQCLLAEYPTPLWILPQYKGKADGEIRGQGEGEKSNAQVVMSLPIHGVDSCCGLKVLN